MNDKGHLDREDKRLLQTAAVIGTAVPLPLLQAIAKIPEEVLHRNLTHLQAAEFLYETHLFPEYEYTLFDHTERLLAGELPNPIDVPTGCRFYDRCPYRMDRCRQAAPALRAVDAERVVACYLHI